MDTCRHLYGYVSASVWIRTGICLDMCQDMYGYVPASVWIRTSICMDMCRHMYGDVPASVWICIGICLHMCWHLHGYVPACVWGCTGICREMYQHMYGDVPEYPWVSGHMTDHEKLVKQIPEENDSPAATAPPWDFVTSSSSHLSCLELVRVSGTLSQMMWVQTSNCRACVLNTDSLFSFIPLALKTLWPPSSLKSPNLGRKLSDVWMGNIYYDKRTKSKPYTYTNLTKWITKLFFFLELLLKCFHFPH